MVPEDGGTLKPRHEGRGHEERGPVGGSPRRREARTGGDPRPVGASLPEAARLLGAAGALEVAVVRRSWATLVGEALAGHTWPVRLQGGVLVVRADDGAWAAELRFHAATVVGRARGLVPGIERLSVGVGPRNEQIW